MLAKTHEYSSRRIATGVAAMAVIGLAALGLTASGTAAAERIKVKVTSATGITLDQDMPAPPAPPSAPEAPGAPEAPEPPTPPAAPEPGTATSHRQVYHYSSDKDGKRIDKVIVTRANGTEDVVVVPNIPPIHVNIPEIRNGKCGKAGPNGEAVMHRQNGDKKVMIICTDRIDAMAENATRMAMHGKRMGLEGARMGIESARRAIQADRSIGDAARAEALKELDEAMSEIAKEFASND